MESSAPFYVIGHPLGHSMSPFIHARLFAAQGREERYTSRDIPPETLDTALPALLKESGGINVTIPYKQAVIPFLDGLCGRAELYRSVNTIRIADTGVFGHNTDAEGFLAALEGGVAALATATGAAAVPSSTRYGRLIFRRGKSCGGMCGG